MSPGSWLHRVRHLLGVVPDAEVARRAGTAQSVVNVARNRLGIPAFRTRTLASYSPDEVLRLVRARSNQGESMRGAPLNDSRLAGLCRYHFGGWYQAVEAAGLKAEGSPRSSAKAPSKPRPLTDRLLRSDKPSADLERLTGVPRSRIKSRRASLGIERDERIGKDRAWLAPVRHLLGKLPDTEIARRVGKNAQLVAAARRRFGIPPCPKPLKAIAGLRERLTALPKAKLRQLLATLPPIDAGIVRERILAERPATLAQIGERFGVSRQRIAQRERRAIESISARP